MWVFVVVISTIIGYFIPIIGKQKALKKWTWFYPLILTSISYFSFTNEPPALKMFILITLLFIGMKVVTTTYRYKGVNKLSFLRWILYVSFWPGMDPKPWEKSTQKIIPDYTVLQSGIISFLLGSIILIGLSFLFSKNLIPHYFTGLFSFFPLILIFHAGIFNIAAFVWGLFNIQLTPLMNKPYKAESLSNFWGKHWNTAFIEMTTIAIFKPLARKGKASVALILAFLVSGIFHEIAISLPVNKYYGFPFLYFAIQAILVFFEKRITQKLSKNQKIIFTWLCLLVPFPLLFHPGFVNGILLPLLECIAKMNY